MTYGGFSAADNGRGRDYAAALVSPSLGSDTSFRMASPPSPAGKNRPRYEPRASSPDSSLDELIDSFRASASSFTFSMGRTDHEQNDGRRTERRTKARGTAAGESSGSDGEGVGVSPMPKLTNAPRPKPSLAIGGGRKSNKEIESRPSSRVQEVATTRSKLPTPKKPTRVAPSEPSKVSIKASSPQRSPRFSSGESTKSSVFDEIEAPDSDEGGEISVDDLISRDLRKLNRLVSSSFELRDHQTLRRSITNEEIEREFRRSTRFRDTDEEHESSAHGRSTSGSPFKLEPVRSILRRRDHAREYTSRFEEDSFASELRLMKEALVKDQEKKKADDAEAKKRRDVEEAKKNEEGPAANIGSLREAVDNIDKSLLIALRPFELMRQEMDKEDAKKAVAEEEATATLDLPAATQSIVDQLEQAFGSLVREREAELKAIEDAAAEAKVTEEANKKTEEEKKAADEADRRKSDEELLKLIPMRGRLFTSESDIHEALLRLELAETVAQNQVRHRVDVRSDVFSVEIGLSNLKEHALRRAREIEQSMAAPVNVIEPRALDWHRSTFHLEEQDSIDEPISDIVEDNDLCSSYPDIVKAEIVDKLDLTILKLRHALSIDKKEAEEKEAQRKHAEDKAAAEAKQKAEEKLKQEEIESNAASARQRVMGIASLEDIPWISKAESQLRAPLHDSRAIERLDRAIDSTRKAPCQPTDGAPSTFADKFTEERHERVKTLIETPYLLPLLYAKPMFQQECDSQRGSPRYYRDSWSAKQRESMGIPPRDNQSGATHERLWSRRAWPPTEVARIVRGHTSLDNQRELELSGPGDFCDPRGYHRNLDDSQDHLADVDTKSNKQDKMLNVKRMIYDLQRNRREKTNWFHSRHR